MVHSTVPELIATPTIATAAQPPPPTQPSRTQKSMYQSRTDFAASFACAGGAAYLSTAAIYSRSRQVRRRSTGTPTVDRPAIHVRVRVRAFC
eukprot:350069-Chlamydomonas_euryale.AAC.3